MIQIIGILLALSLIGNAWLFKSRDAALEAGAKFEQANGTLAAGVTACSTSIDNLAKDSTKRHKDALEALNQASGRIKGLQHEALTALQAKPADPQDLCGSFQAFVREQIKRERGTSK